MFSNILIYFVVIPVVMLLGLFLCRNIKQIRAVAVTGSVALTALSSTISLCAPPEPPTRCFGSTPGNGSPPSTSTLR